MRQTERAELPKRQTKPEGLRRQSQGFDSLHALHCKSRTCTVMQEGCRNPRILSIHFPSEPKRENRGLAEPIRRKKHQNNLLGDSRTSMSSHLRRQLLPLESTNRARLIGRRVTSTTSTDAPALAHPTSSTTRRSSGRSIFLVCACPIHDRRSDKCEIPAGIRRP